MLYDDNVEDFNDDSDSLIGDPTRPTTTDIGSIIAAAMRATGAPGGQQQRVFQEAVFPVGVVPRQGAQVTPGQRAIRPDVSFIGPDGMRVNLEVDNRPERSRQHVIEHLRAMRQAQRSGLAPTTGTRSVFLETDRSGRIQRLRHVSYRLNDRGQVVRDRQRSFTRSYRGAGPTVAEALRRGLIDRQPVRRGRHVRRGVRPFDAFTDGFAFARAS